MKFAGFEDWIPIFRGGKQTDSNGVEHDGDALIDKALANFNAAVHEPPICIGHPKEDAPSYGWVEGLKKHGNLLLAKFKQVQPDFADMVKNGSFKKRSAAFYPDGSLRHVGFLGAMPPAVKGLPDVAFAEGDAASFEFSEPWAWNSLADVFRRLREWLIEKEGQDTADRIVPDWKIEDLRSAANPPADETQQINYKEKKKEVVDMNFKEKLKAFLGTIGFDVSKIPDDAIPGEAPANTGIQYSEADLEKIRKEAEDKGKQKAQAEFAEQQKQIRLSTIKTEIAAFCESLIKAGKITPATVSFGLPEILFSMAEIDNQIEFGEKKEKFTAFDRMKALLESATPLVTFKEVATRDKDTGGGTGTAGAKLDTMTKTKMSANKELSYSAAFAEVQKENPELATEYQAEIAGDK
ncbi:hypothetical protein SMITH_190 [Smithella sp. ME-1]|nr:hypothetical protein SMITH_190 [Smithella sp. ME-1]